MSRIGKKAIPIPPGVKVVVEAPNVKVSGPKGNLKIGRAHV
jgi:ribosomal protein L6P/L9E